MTGFASAERSCMELVLIRSATTGSQWRLLLRACLLWRVTPRSSERRASTFRSRGFSRFFRMRSYTNNGKRVALTGFMGVGKSSVARHLSALLDCDKIDLDNYIEQNENRLIHEIID